MEPLSITLTIFSLIQTTDHIVTAVRGLSQYRKLPTLIFNLRNEVTELKSVLEQLRRADRESNPVLRLPEARFQQTFSQITELLEDLVNALRQLDADCTKSKATVILKTSFWKSGQGKFKDYRKQIKYIKASLSLMLNTESWQRLKLVQDDVWNIATSNEKLVEIHKKAIQQGVGDVVDAFKTHFDRFQSDLNSTIHDLHRPQLATEPTNPHSAPTQSIVAGVTSANHLPNTRTGMPNRRPGRKWCPCRCHAKQHLSLLAPDFVEAVLGRMFIGYYGLPFFKQQCDFAGCQDERGAAATLEYRFPAWLMAKNTKLRLKFLPSIGSQYQLSTINRVADDSQSITYAMHGNIEGLKSLFARRLSAPKDVSDSRGYTLVRWALYGGMHNHATVQFLIDQGALVDEESYENVWDFIYRGKCNEPQRTALRCITESNDHDWIEDQNFPLIHRIVLGMDSKPLSAEIEDHPHSIHYKDAQNRTALDWATARAQLNDMQLLLAHHGPHEMTLLNNMDVTGRTAVLHAVDSHNVDGLKMILAAGGEPNPEYPKGIFRSSPLTAAGFSGNAALLKALLEEGAEVAAANPEGLTALHSVAQTNNTDCAALLLEYGSSLNAISKDGQTPLTIAIARNNHPMLRRFIDKYYGYETCSHFKDSGILPIVAEHADIQTMRILAESLPLKASYDLSPGSISASRAILKDRVDFHEGLAEAFDELVEVAISEADEVKSIESVLGSTLFVSARSSFHSEIAGALSRLNSLQNSPTGLGGNEQGTWMDKLVLFESPTSPVAAAGFPDPSQTLDEKGPATPGFPRSVV